MELQAKPVLKWSGAKWNIAGWITTHLPNHEIYLEPYFGSGAVFFSKPPAKVETLNDLSGEVCNLFRVVRDRTEELCRAVTLTPWSRQEYEECRRGRGHGGDEVERARRFLVTAWQQIGIRYGATTWTGGWRARITGDADTVSVWNALPDRIAVAARRLKEAQIECRPALDVITRYRHPDALLYVDPPYPKSLRSRHLYEHNLTDDDHRELLAVLSDHPGPVLVSGYRCALYDDFLSRWSHIERNTRTQSCAHRTEVLWMNPEAAKRLNQKAFEF